MSLLKSCSWSKPALKLLEDTKQLDPSKPALLHIRHTERPTPNIDQYNDLNKILSTDTGKKTANEFGSLLPLNRKIRLYHTTIDRSRETAEEIRKGVKEAGGSSELAGVIPYLTAVDEDERTKFMKPFRSRREYAEGAVYYVTCLWTAGLIPTNVFRPSYEFAKDYAEYTVRNLRDASSDELHVYVTHDLTILSLIFHWFGLPPYGDGCSFLEGFLLQLGEDGIKVWLRDRAEVYNYPYWWPK